MIFRRSKSFNLAGLIEYYDMRIGLMKRIICAERNDFSVNWEKPGKSA
jgi:hypothetical protein